MLLNISRYTGDHYQTPISFVGETTLFVCYYKYSSALLEFEIRLQNQSYTSIGMISDI